MLVLLLSAAASADMNLRIAGQLPFDHPATDRLEAIRDRIEGAGVGLEVQLFPAGQLGSGEPLLGDVARGVIDISHSFIYSHYDPRLELSTIPYLVEDYDAMARSLAPGSRVYATLAEILDGLGVRLLGICSEGFVGAAMGRMPNDARGVGPKGLTLRVWSSRVLRETVQDLGYTAIAIDRGDAFAAVQQGVVDGLFGTTPEQAYTMFRDTIKFYIPYAAFVQSTAFYMNADTWNRLTIAQQAVVQQTFTQAMLGSFARAEANDRAFMERLEQDGIRIVELSDADRKTIAAHVRANTWPKLEPVFGQDFLDTLVVKPD